MKAAWWLWLVVGLAYFVLPVDAIPDFLFPVGYTDDLGVGALALFLAKKAKENQP